MVTTKLTLLSQYAPWQYIHVYMWKLFFKHLVQNVINNLVISKQYLKDMTRIC